MKEKKANEIQMDLCTPCAMGLTADGRKLRVAKNGVNRKALCAVCGRKRYAAVYYVTKDAGQQRADA